MSEGTTPLPPPPDPAPVPASPRPGLPPARPPAAPPGAGPDDAGPPVTPSRAATMWIGQLIHQGEGLNPTVVDVRRSAACRSEEQPYQRHLAAGEEWRPLDAGWLAEAGAGVGVLCFENRGVGPRQVVPTPEEAADEGARVVVLAVVPDDGPAEDGGRTMHSAARRSASEPVPVAYLTPGGFPAWLPTGGDVARFRYRCLHRTTRVVVTAFPA